MITGTNELKTLTKHISCECKYKFDKNNCWCECKKHHICEKDYIWNPSVCICENRKYLASIVDDSVIMCDEVIEKAVPTNFNEKKE